MIRSVDVHVLRSHAADGFAEETALVTIEDEEGNVGYGEADAPATVVRELVTMDDLHGWSRGLRQILQGKNPLDIRGLWQDCYQGTLYHGRLGLGIHALSGIDLALHDLAGTRHGLPVYQLLGGAVRDRCQPVAIVYATGQSANEFVQRTVDVADAALGLGFTSLKINLHVGEMLTDADLVAVAHELLSQVAPKSAVALDFGFRWSEWRDALRPLRRLDEWATEYYSSPLHPDDADGHRELRDRLDTRIASGKFASTLEECRRWIELGAVDIIQPDLSRCGGLTEAQRIASAAADHGIDMVPHAWKTGINLAATRHFHAAIKNVPFIEVFASDLYPEWRLRAELTGPDPLIDSGEWPLPEGPGLCTGIRQEAIAKFLAG